MHLAWFRSDLRIADNPALHNALTGEPARALYFVTEQQWQQRHNWGANKIGFVLANVLKLQADLSSLNITLDILYCDFFDQIPNLLVEYAHKNNCTRLSYNKEYELNEHLRDVAVEKLCKQKGIACYSFDDQCLLPPGTIFNKQANPYNVFTAFKKAYYPNLNINKIKITPKPKKQKLENLAINMPKIHASLQRYLVNPILESWPPGEKAATKLLHDFCEQDLLHYKEQRDFPGLDATSKLSAYLAVGAISVKQCFLAAVQANDFIFPGNNPSIMCWIDELIWRDFYRNIIFHNPRICKGENYNTKYNRIKWQAPASNFEKWASGTTGIPIIDAAMRQLVQTGWMHNRLRMITAMFLTKHLLIDWRHGEKFFSEHLIDLDFASNNGGWQWCASTGTDAVPYFRIFNPITQSQRFDLQGNFIRKYCPELKHLNNKQIHNPSGAFSASELVGMNYVGLMIDLSQARTRALQAFKS